MTSRDDNQLSLPYYEQDQMFVDLSQEIMHPHKVPDSSSQHQHKHVNNQSNLFDPVPIDPSACRTVNQLSVSEIWEQSFQEERRVLEEFTDLFFEMRGDKIKKEIDNEMSQETASNATSSFYSCSHSLNMAREVDSSPSNFQRLQETATDQMNFHRVPTPNPHPTDTIYRAGMQEDDSTASQSACNPNSKSDLPINQDRWEDRFNELKYFVQINGHCHVPTHLESNPSLARWCKRQRYQYKLKRSGGHSTLTDEREQKLNEVNFVWDVHSSSWEERFMELVDFKMKYGHTNVPRSRGKLGSWVKSQRRQYSLYIRKEKSHLTPDRVAKMNSLGFEWVGSKNPFPRDEYNYMDGSA